MENLKNLVKMTDEYASNLNMLFIKISNDDANSYEKTLKHMFRNFFHTDNDMKTFELWSKYGNIIDIVIIEIESGDDIQKQNLTSTINNLREYNKYLPVYAIVSEANFEQSYKMLAGCYCLDGVVPFPFKKEAIYNFFFRLLKRVTDINDLNIYVESLENQLFTSTLSNELLEGVETLHVEENKLDNSTKERKKIDEDRNRDLRFTQHDKISATRFLSTLDSSIIDKVEKMSEHLDDFIAILYDFEDASSADSCKLLPSIIETINEIFIVVESIGSFTVVARAFGSLNYFLENLHEDNFKQEEKQLFAKMLTSVALDLEKWIKVIFIEQSTEDIHYFDASFASNILEIESVFVEHEESDDEDDLEFF
ncbi:MAG: hypothetical protein U9N42_05785 [Campylobacterota bacterium]|nr:hypothetical protein [Campylobacterota bacterium]